MCWFQGQRKGLETVAALQGLSLGAVGGRDRQACPQFRAALTRGTQSSLGEAEVTSAVGWGSHLSKF